MSIKRLTWIDGSFRSKPKLPIWHRLIGARASSSVRAAQHGIRRAMNVILQGDGSPFGVLEVDSKTEGEFGEHDLAFLQGAANILGMAIEQQQYQRKLQVALDRHQVLLKEVNHRVKNSLQVVSAMLQLQATSVGDPDLSERLNEASNRVNAVGRAYERLAYNADYENINLVEYLREKRPGTGRSSLRDPA